MNQGSEERAPERAEPRRTAASILPFEKPQSPQQRHIRQRVQERLDREGIKKRPQFSPVRLIVTLAVAVIPVVLTFGASDAVLRKIQLLTRLYAPPPAAQTAMPPAPPAEEDRPGILMIVPDPALEAPSTPAAAPSTAAPQAPAESAARPGTAK
jgi:hypothetical protein